LKKPSKKNPHRGSTFDSFLAEESILEDVTTAALKRVLAWQLAELMKKRRISKSEMAKRMRTSRAALERLLDSENTSVTLQTMGRAAAALGKTLTVSFKDAA
jgi:DNA-binding Xre family transcriptional regulator